MFSFLKRARLKREFFSCPPDPSDLFYAGNIAVNCQANSFSIKSLSTLNQLLEQKKETVYRFLVDTEGKLWFAFETRPNNNAPKHFQMTGEPLETARCLTAGNLKFKNEMGTHLKNISHRSGDFYPSFLSLRWVLAILLINEAILPFKLPKILIVKEIRGKKVYKHAWRLKRAQKWLDSFRHNEMLMNQLDQAALSSKTVHYKSINYSTEASA